MKNNCRREGRGVSWRTGGGRVVGQADVPGVGGSWGELTYRRREGRGVSWRTGGRRVMVRADVPGAGGSRGKLMYRGREGRGVSWRTGVTGRGRGRLQLRDGHLEAADEDLHLVHLHLVAPLQDLHLPLPRHLLALKTALVLLVLVAQYLADKVTNIYGDIILQKLERLSFFCNGFILVLQT